MLSGSLTVPGRIERYGAPREIGAGLAISTVLQIAVALAFSALVKGPLLYVFGFALAGDNVGINVEANRVEIQTGRETTSQCHGRWALGFLAAS